MNPQAAQILEGRKDAIREPFVEGDTRAFLKAAAGPLVEPLIEDSVADIRSNLQRGDRFDVLEWIAEESGGLTRGEMEEQAESLRGVVSAANGAGSIVALVIVAVGVLVMAPGASAQACGDAAMARHHIDDGRGRLPDSGVHAQLHHPRPDQGCCHRRRIPLPRRAGDSHGLGGRPGGVIHSTGHCRLHTADGHRDGHWGSAYSGVSAVRLLAGSGWATAPSWKS